MDSPLTVVLWRWKKANGWSLNYTAEHVNAMCRMLKAHLHMAHRVVCVTDDPDGIECETIPLWEHGTTETLHGKPNCFKRLYAFSKDVVPIFGPRFVSMDLDCVIFPGRDGKGITPLFENDNDFMIVNGWRNQRGCCPYNGSMWLMNTGARSHVWDTFDPITSPEATKGNRMPSGTKWFGSDQCWIAHAAPDEKTWCRADGVMSFVRDAKSRRVPHDCRIMFFAGHMKPWSSRMRTVNPTLGAEYQKYL